MADPKRCFEDEELFKFVTATENLATQEYAGAA